jgi:DNA-binding protein HU-beta
MVMRSLDVVAHVAEATGLEKTKVESVLDSFAGVLTKELRDGEEFRYKGVGKFKVKDRPERPGRDPRTGSAITVKASRTVRFTAAGELKKAVQVQPAA